MRKRLFGEVDKILDTLSNKSREETMIASRSMISVSLLVFSRWIMAVSVFNDAALISGNCDRQDDQVLDGEHVDELFDVAVVEEVISALGWRPSRRGSTATGDASERTASASRSSGTSAPTGFRCRGVCACPLGCPGVRASPVPWSLLGSSGTGVLALVWRDVLRVFLSSIGSMRTLLLMLS